MGCGKSWRALGYFNPRSSCEERHRRLCTQARFSISIHAPHARSDLVQDPPIYTQTDFNPRSSCEERPARRHLDIDLLTSFQSTLLMRGATFFDVVQNVISGFQSTLLMRGATQDERHRAHYQGHFNPRSSCEERPKRPPHRGAAYHFNPRSSCEERPPPRVSSASGSSDFNPRSSCEERHRRRRGAACRRHFNPRSSCEERRS